MRVLITGGNGFIGSHLCDRLVERGHEVQLIDLQFGKHVSYLGHNLFQGDISDEDTLGKVPCTSDLVLHFAAVSRVEWGEADPGKCVRVNTQGMLNVIKHAIKFRKIPHIIFASSREVYGEPVNLPVTEDHPKEPISVYGITKLMAEKLLVHFSVTNGIKYTIVRFSNVYGSERDLPERVTPRFMALALRGDPMTVNGGQQVLDFTFIDDVVDGVVKLIDRVENRDEAVANTEMHFTTCRGFSILQLACLVKEVTHSSSEIAVNQERPFDVTRFIGDYSKARRLLGYEPKISLEDGLRKYLNRITGN
jgi:nucleoside-diphosphate-sugar epimerase